MQSLMIVLLGIAGMSFGWFVYSKFIASKIYQLDENFVTPAHEFSDGVDYHPTNKYVLWGHHFTSVAGAAPIVGPAIAVYWGWVPAVLWVTIGTIFFAGVHDFGAIWASARHQGKSIGALSEAVIGKRTRALFMVVIFLVLLMVNAVFGVVIAGALVNTPGAVFPAWSAIAVALVIGTAAAPQMELDAAVGRRRCRAVRVDLRGQRVTASAAGRDVRSDGERQLDHHFVRLRGDRVDAAGLGVAAAARLHQRHSAVRRSHLALRRRRAVAARHLGTRVQRPHPRRCTVSGAALVRHDCLRGGVGFPRDRVLRYHVEAARQGDRCAFCRVFGRRR